MRDIKVEALQEKNTLNILKKTDLKEPVKLNKLLLMYNMYGI